jgi:site-specific DNA-methyltransferase (adenine-specific)
VLRDVTERVIIASKGRFDRAVGVDERRARDWPNEASVSTDEFLDATLDLWRIPPESARHVGHPAPFPVELPQRLIELYTFQGDLVLDPFLGSGSTAVAAARTGRRYVGYDTDPDYIELARARVAEELEHGGPPTREGRAAQVLAADLLEDAGFRIVDRKRKVAGLGLEISLVAEDAGGRCWYFDVTGAFTSTGKGLLRSDTLWRSLGRASVLASCQISPLVLLSSHLPARNSAGNRALRALGPDRIHDVVGLLVAEDRARLATYAQGSSHARALPGFWTPAELELP